MVTCGTSRAERWFSRRHLPLISNNSFLVETWNSRFFLISSPVGITVTATFSHRHHSRLVGGWLESGLTMSLNARLSTIDSRKSDAQFIFFVAMSEKIIKCRTSISVFAITWRSQKNYRSETFHTPAARRRKFWNGKKEKKPWSAQKWKYMKKNTFSWNVKSRKKNVSRERKRYFDGSRH